MGMPMNVQLSGTSEKQNFLKWRNVFAERLAAMKKINVYCIFFTIPFTFSVLCCMNWILICEMIEI